MAACRSRISLLFKFISSQEKIEHSKRHSHAQISLRIARKFSLASCSFLRLGEIFIKGKDQCTLKNSKKFFRIVVFIYMPVSIAVIAAVSA